MTSSEHVLDLARRPARRQPGAVADAEQMRVDGDGRLAEGDVEHDIGGLAADAGQRFRAPRGSAGTSEPNSAISLSASARTFFALLRKRPMVLIMRR